jgi:D-proline reductase (dithiol) PrdB
MTSSTNKSDAVLDSPIPYMQHTREYYRAIGYDTPYRWAHNTSAPFQPLKKPLAKARVARG